MPNKDQAISFINKALTDPCTNLLLYKNNRFGDELRLKALDDIIFILLSLNQTLLHTKLADMINTPHSQTKLNLLDYCLASGLDELALRLAFCGARSDNMLFFEQRLDLHFKQDPNCPQMVLDIKECIGELKLASSEHNKQTKEQPARNFFTEHKYPAVLFSIGIAGITGGIIVYPFLHGAASALLLSVGVPSILSSINSLQASSGGKDRVSQTEASDRLTLETKELNNLIKIAIKAKKELQMRMLESSIKKSFTEDKKLHMLANFSRSRSEPGPGAKITEPASKPAPL